MWPFTSGVSFTPSKDIPALTGKVILVTGGNTGLGEQSILEFARYGRPAKIFLAARSADKAQATIAKIQSAVGGQEACCPIIPLSLDLTSFESIKSAARTFVHQSDRLDILMLNAGIMAVPAGQTKEGYEIQLGTNHVGHALLTKLLLPTLLSTAERPGADVRVVVLSSAGMGIAPKLGFDPTWAKTDGSAVYTWTRYGQSKLANALFARELARRYPAIRAVAVHPGAVNTNLMIPLSQSSLVAKVLLAPFKLLIATAETGARNQVWASVSDQAKSGEYYTPVGVVGNDNKLARDDGLAARLWEWTEKELEGQEI